MAEQSNNGRCFLRFSNDTDGNCEMMRIEFTADLGRLPSTSNSKRIVYPKTNRVVTRAGQKFYGRFSTPRIAHSAKYSEKSKCLLSAFYAEALRTKLKSPAFPDKTLVQVFAILPRIAHTFDSHNFCKPIGDFLQNAGVICNDTWLQIFCVKQVDYPELGPTESTVIYLMPEAPRKTLISNAIREIINGI